MKSARLSGANRFKPVGASKRARLPPDPSFDFGPGAFERIKAASRPDSQLRFEKSEHNYYEDVLGCAQDRAPTREVLLMDRATAEELARTGDLLWRLTNIYEPRHEFLTTGDPTQFRRVAQLFLGPELAGVTPVDVRVVEGVSWS